MNPDLTTPMTAAITPPNTPSSTPSTSAITPALDAAAPPLAQHAAGSRFGPWLREPLLHFALAGLAIFAADQWLNQRRADPRHITVSKATLTEARELFRAGMNREPSAADMTILQARWVDNEVLYREGLALGLDRGDSNIRERVIFKALSLTQAGVVLPKIDEAGLRAWFNAQRERYDPPARVDFQEAVLSQDRSAERVKGFVDALNGKGESDAQSGLHVFKDRPLPTVLQAYGTEFTTALEQLAPGRWEALPSLDGLRVVRLESRKAGTQANFDEIKEKVYLDWKNETIGQLTTQAIRDIGKKYPVKLEGAGS